MSFESPTRIAPPIGLLPNTIIRIAPPRSLRWEASRVHRQHLLQPRHRRQPQHRRDHHRHLRLQQQRQRQQQQRQPQRQPGHRLQHLRQHRLHLCKRQMTIDHTKVPSTQSNFTVLVSLTDPALKTIANGGHVANANGFDIGFYADSGGTTKLKWEVEKYDGTTGNLIAWVKIPSVSSTTDTPFYLFYGDPSITTNQSDPVNTWDANFKAVYHFGNGTTLTATDSTGGNNGTLFNSPTASAGKINGAAHFVNSSNQAIGLANPGDFPVATAWTMETWVKPSTDGNAVMAWGGTSNNGPHMVLLGNNTWRVGFWGGADVNGTGVDTTAFHHIVGTFDGSSLRLYKDGSLIAGPTAASPTTSSNTGAAIATSFGAYYFDGNVDELRISNTNRSAAWITTEYNNQNSPGTFITMGSENCAF